MSFNIGSLVKKGAESDVDSPDKGGLFNNLERRKPYQSTEKIGKTSRDVAFYEDGNDDDFSFMKKGNVCGYFNEVLEKELNNTATPPGGGNLPLRGRAGRVMARSSEVDPLDVAKLQQNNIAASPRPGNIKQGFALGGFGAASMAPLKSTRSRPSMNSNKSINFINHNNNKQQGKLSLFDRSRKDQANVDRRSSLRNDYPVRHDELRTKRNVPNVEQRRQQQQDIIVDEEKKKENRDKTKRGSEIFDLGNKSFSSDKIHRNSADSTTKLGFTKVNNETRIPKKKNGGNPINTPGHSLTDDSWRSHTDSGRASKESSSLGIHPTIFYSGTKSKVLKTVQNIRSSLENSVTQLANTVFHTPPSEAQSKRRKKNNTEKEVVIIDDSDDEMELENEVSKNVTRKSDRLSQREEDEPLVKRKPRFGSRLEINLVRVAIGSTVFSHRCRLQFQLGTSDPFVVISFAESDDTLTEKEIKISLLSIGEIKYCLDEEDDNTAAEQITFIAFKLSYSERYLLSREALQTLRVSGNFDAAKDIYSSFFSCEVRDDTDFKEKLPKLRENQILGIYLEPDSKVGPENADLYISVFKKHTESERLARLSASPRRLRRSARFKSSTATISSEAKQKIILVYPFVGGDSIEKAAKDLKLSSVDEKRLSIEELTSLQKEATTGRAHILTITGEDRDRLEPGEFLNDTLVDFWMRWISRKEAPQKSCVHFFTSHFYTTLQDEGVDAVSSWTTKKGIDIFSKRIIFLPINQSLHWSLCAVVNPGLITNYDEIVACNGGPNNEILDIDNEETLEHTQMEVPCIIFLDSLKAHQKNVVAGNVRRWLNHEWKKIKGGETDVFNKQSIKLFAPKVPYQNNSWDCGVFVCKYAFSLYQLRYQQITFKELHLPKPLSNAITENDLMKFTMSDIAVLREEMGKLVDNLSHVYLDEKQNKRQPKPESQQEHARIDPQQFVANEHPNHDSFVAHKGSPDGMDI